jgi:TM2 domain-containing membrane protein YozV
MPEFSISEQQRMLVGMNDQQRMLFQSQYASERKDRTMVLVLSVLFGGFGVDRFMIGDMGMGLLKLLTVGGFGIIYLIDLFLIMGRTDEYNRRKAEEICVNIRMTSPNYPVAGYSPPPPPVQAAPAPTLPPTMPPDFSPTPHTQPNAYVPPPAPALSQDIETKSKVLPSIAIVTVILVAIGVTWSMRSSRSPTDNTLQMTTDSKPSDSTLQELAQKLIGDSSLGSDGISVHVSEGVVTLSGEVPNGASRELASQLLVNKSGIRVITNNLTITTTANQQTANAISAAPSDSQAESNAALYPVMATTTQDKEQLGTQRSLSNVDDEIQQTLRRWTNAMRTNDSAAEAAEYAPKVEKYYSRSDVDNSSVAQDKQAFIDHGNRVTSLTLENVSFEQQTSSTATLRLVKDVFWQGNAGNVHKLIPSRLQLQRFPEGWKIIGEQDFH